MTGYLGDSDFVDSVLGQTEEHSLRQSGFRRRGYGLQKVAERVAEIYGVKVGGFSGEGASTGGLSGAIGCVPAGNWRRT